MDIRYFLKARTAFIHQFYDTCSATYIERKRKIETQEAPFEPPYSEDGEPPFLREWIEADESLQVLAYSCISMLASSLHLYLKTFERTLHLHTSDSFKSEFKKGWLNGYKAYFAHHLDIRFENCPADLKVLEEVVLARNRVQHPESIVSHSTQYSNSDLRTLVHPFFIGERERRLLANADEAEINWLMPPTLHINGEQLSAAIEQVEVFSDWLEDEIDYRVYQR